MKRENKARMKQRARNICLVVAYDGTAYCGFQRQTNGVVAVQNVLENALNTVFGDDIDLTAAGRTDAGVHANGQVVNFFTDGKIPAAKIPQAVNAYLPSDIVVRAACEVAKDFSALHDAKSKIYTYKIYRATVSNPLICRYAWHVESKLDVSLMQKALSSLKGEHDFASFCAAGSTAKSTVRTLYAADAFTETPPQTEWALSVFAQNAAEETPQIITIAFHGNGFLYHMVRNIIGSLVYVGRKRYSLDDFAALLAARDRRRGAPTAPATGLCLQEVRY